MIGHKVTKNVEIHNDTGIAYISGDEYTEGSKRFIIDSDTGFTEIQILTSGVWQPASLELGANTLWLGKNVGVAGLGHHLATEAKDGHLHFHAHSEFNGETSVADVQVVNAYGFATRLIAQPDESGIFAGTELMWSTPAVSHILLSKLYYKTSAAATDNIRIRFYKGTGDTGDLLFDQTYPPSSFSADTEVELPLSGRLEFYAGNTYSAKITSATDFSFKTNAAQTIPWYAVDVSYIREDNLLQTKPWVSGDSWDSGDYIIDSRKLYICNTTGVQSGTFASNSALWDSVGDTGEHYWTKAGGTLNYNDGTRDRATFTDSISRLLSGDGTFEIKATGNEASFSYSQAYLRMQSDNLVYRDGGNDRLKIDGTATLFKSHNGVQTITLDDTGTTFNGAVNTGVLGVTGNLTATGTINGLTLASGGITYSTNYGINDGTRNRIYSSTTLTELYSPDGDSNLSVGNTGIALVSRGYAALDADATSTKLWGPGNNGYLTLTDTSLDFHDSTRTRISSDASNTKTINPDGTKSITLSNSIIDVQTTWFNIGDGTRTRFDTKTDRTGLWCPDGNDSIIMTNAGTTITTNSYVDIKSSSQARIRVNATETELLSPTEVYTLMVRDAYTNIWDGTRARFSSDTTDTRLVGPDGTSLVILSNSGTVITGPTTVCSGLGNDSLVIEPYDELYSGGSMYLMGTWMQEGKTSKSSNYAIDNFWGYMRIFSGADGPKYIRMSNAKQEPTAADKMHLNIDGSIIAGVPSGSKTVSAGIELRSTTEAFLLSRMTTTERNALTATAGLVIFNTTTSKMECYDGSTWQVAW